MTTLESEEAIFGSMVHENGTKVAVVALKVTGSPQFVISEKEGEIAFSFHDDVEKGPILQVNRTGLAIRWNGQMNLFSFGDIIRKLND